MSLNRFVRQLKPIQENKVNYVDRVQTYLTEADTQDATRMEQSICVGYNMLKNLKLSQEDAVKLAEIKPEEWGKIKQIIIDKGKAVAEEMLPLDIGNHLIHYGRGDAKNYFEGAGDTTPKTDFYSDKGRTFSLKKAEGAQLLSPKGAEATGVVKAAIENAQKEGAGIDAETQGKIENALKKLEEDLDKIIVDDVYISTEDSKKSFVDWYTTESGRKEELETLFNKLKFTRTPSDKQKKDKIMKHMKTELAPFKATNFKRKGTPAYNKGLLGFDTKKPRVDPKTGIDDKQYRKYLENFAGSNFKLAGKAIKNKPGKEYLKTKKDFEFVENDEDLRLKVVDFLEKSIEQATFKAMIEEAFEGAKDVQKFVVYEGASGHYKFTGKLGTDASNVASSTPAVASELLTFDTKGGKDKIVGKVKHDKDIYKWAEKNYNLMLDKLMIDFKGTTASKKRYTKFAIGIPKINLFKEEWYEIIDTEIEFFQEELRDARLQLAYLEEGILDYVKGKFVSAKDAIKNMYKKLVDIVKRIYKNIVLKFLEKARELIKKGLNALIEFLGLEISSAEVKFK